MYAKVYYMSLLLHSIGVVEAHTTILYEVEVYVCGHNP